MTNRAKAIGTFHETATVKYLISRGYQYAKRITLKGNKDEGDVVLSERIPVVIEAKGGRGAVTNIPKGLRELEVEIANAQAEFGFTVVKKSGTTDVGEYYAITPVRRMIDLVARVWPPEEPVAPPKQPRVWRKHK